MVWFIEKALIGKIISLICAEERTQYRTENEDKRKLISSHSI